MQRVHDPDLAKYRETEHTDGRGINELAARAEREDAVETDRRDNHHRRHDKEELPKAVINRRPQHRECDQRHERRQHYEEEHAVFRAR